MDPAAVPAGLDVGHLLAGRYRLEELIGRGGMASVFRARDIRLGRQVAVKVLRPEALADGDLAVRFRREAHAATVLRHANIVACLDTGTDDGRPFLVMEMVEGEDLAALLRGRGRLPWQLAVRIAADVGRGLGAAHARGFVHRDVKPGNILLAVAGRAVITDFGIARLAGEAEATLPGTTLGSVHYFSPEQARGATTTPASDVYSLGLVLFEALTGRRAFGGDSPAAIALARVDAVAPSPRSLEPSIPPAIEAVVGRALEPSPAARYRDGAALAAALEAAYRAVVEAPPAQPRPSKPARPAIARVAVVVTALGVVVASLVGISVMRPDGGADRAGGPPGQGTPASSPVAAGLISDLCDPDDDGSCPIEAGRYEPARFEPRIAFTVADGWSVARYYEDGIVLARAEGFVTIASGVSVVFDEGEPRTVGTSARSVADAIRANDELEVLARGRMGLDGVDARVLEVVPVRDGRVPVFRTSDDTFYAEVRTVTRFIALDVDGRSVLVALEGAGGHDLDDLLGHAMPVLEDLAFR